MNYLLVALLTVAQQPDPNHPGIIDPMGAHWLGNPVRLPGSLQVHGDSELVNIVGRVRRRDADRATSRRNVPVQRTKTAAEDVQDTLVDLGAAAGNGNSAAMVQAAQELRAILLGETLGNIYDGFPLLNHVQANPLSGQIAGEYRAKRLVDGGQRVAGVLGGQDKVWELDVALLYADERIYCDTAVFTVPADAAPLDRLHVRYFIYSMERADFAPATLLDDHQVFGEGRLASKGFDAAWLPLHNKEVTLVTVDHGSLGALRGIQVWNWRADPDASTTIQPLREIIDPQSGQPRLDARGTVIRERLRGLDLDAIGDAAPAKKILQVADAVLAGAQPAQVTAMLTQAGTAPSGTAFEWVPLLTRRGDLPQEAWDLLALEGIQPGQPGPNPSVRTTRSGCTPTTSCTWSRPISSATTRSLARRSASPATCRARRCWSR